VTNKKPTSTSEQIAKTQGQSKAIRLAARDQECFANALLSAPKETAALKHAFSHRRKLLAQVWD